MQAKFACWGCEKRAVNVVLKKYSHLSIGGVLSLGLALARGNEGEGKESKDEKGRDKEMLIQRILIFS